MKYFSLLFASLLVGCTTTSETKYSGYGLGSISQQTLAKYAPPTPNAELKNKIEKLVDIRAPNEGMITSDGRTLFMNWNVTGSLQIWKLTGPKSFPIQLTSGEDASRLTGMSPNSEWIVISRDSKGDENPGIYLMKTNGGELRKVYYNPKHQTSLLGFTKDSKFLYYRTNDKTPESYSIYKYNLASDFHEIIWSEPGIWTLSDIMDDKAILTLLKGSMQNEHFLFDLKTKTKEPLLGQNELEDFEVAFTKNKDEYIVLTNKLADFRKLYLFKNGKLTPWGTNVDADISDFKLSEDRNHLVYVINQNGYSRLQMVHLPSGKNSTLPGLEQAQQAYVGSFSKNNRYLSYSAEYHNAPRKNFVFDLQKKKAQEWVLPSTPEIDTLGYVKPSLESFKAQDGTDVPMFVWRSEKCKTEVCPVIVQFHGGPEAQFIPRFSPLYNLYTEKGFVYVAPNVRGSDGYGKKWLQADNGVKRLEVITDIRDCAEFIKKNWAKNGVVPKIGITGGSYGGYSTLVGASMFADSYDAGLAIVGMSSLITFIENTAPYRRALRMNEYGDPAKDRETMLKLSPVSYIDQVTKPLMIAHGATDPRVPVGEAVQFYETIQKKNKNSKLVIFPDEGHGVAKRANIVLLNTYALDFFEQHLKQ
jgi:dipeptidyl aminopeptidase/acylaminoacyl peptidase